MINIVRFLETWKKDVARKLAISISSLGCCIEPREMVLGGRELVEGLIWLSMIYKVKFSRGRTIVYRKEKFARIWRICLASLSYWCVVEPKFPIFDLTSCPTRFLELWDANNWIVLESRARSKVANLKVERKYRKVWRGDRGERRETASNEFDSSGETSGHRLPISARQPLSVFSPSWTHLITFAPLHYHCSPPRAEESSLTLLEHVKK